MRVPQGGEKSTMKPTRTKYRIAAIVFSGVICAQSARADGLSGLYLGGDFGRAHNDYDPAYVDNQFQNEVGALGYKLKFNSSSVQRDDNAWWVGSGYMLWTHFGFDAAFLRLGELTGSTSATLQGQTGHLPATISATLASHGPAVSLIARLPLADSLDVDMRIGDYYGKTTLTGTLGVESKSISIQHSSSSSSLLVGIGAAYTLVGHWTIRLDYLRIDQAGNSNSAGTFNVNLAAAGLVYTF